MTENKLLEGSETLVDKWGKALEGINDPYTRKVTAVLFENQARHILIERAKILNEDLSAGATTVGNLGTFQKWAFPLVRRVYPQLIANSIVGQQPMQGPVSQIFYLGAGRQYGATRQSIYNKYQLTYRNMVTSAIGGSGIDLDTTANPVLSALYGRQKGSPSTTFGGQIAAWPNTTTILGFNVSSGEYLAGTGIPEVNLSIEQQPVVARTRKMRALWTIEASQDAKAYHNLDLEQEVTELMSNEIKLEVDRELIEDIRGIAYDANAGPLGGWYRDALDNRNSNNFQTIGGHDNFTPVHFLWTFNNSLPITTNPSGTAQNVWVIDFSSSSLPFAPQHVGQVWSNLLAILNLASQDIFTSTHRGPGTWLVTSPLIGALLETAAQLQGGMQTVEGPTNMGKQITFKGRLAGKYDLYIDPLFPEDEILMGYKGAGPMDTGFMYCPYIPFELIPNVVDPETFQPRKGILTRYGKAAITPESRFYRVIRIVGPTANYLVQPFGRNSTNTPGL